MKIQITKYNKWLKEFWNVCLWSIHKVVRIKETREETYFYINVIANYGNCKGHEETIMIKGNECRVLGDYNRQLDDVLTEIYSWIDKKAEEIKINIPC